MDFNSVDYGYEILSKFDRVLKRDYNKILDGEFTKERGISLLIYINKHNLNIWINYLPNNSIKFEIELEQNTILNSYWKNEDVNESVMEYFEFIIRNIINDLEKRNQHLQSFNSRKWINLEKKVDKLLNNEY